MKYGIMLYVSTDNIGDDIQCYAAKRFLPRIDAVIDRENLDTFGLNNEEREPVSVIMNGWYMYKKFNWPPSNLINPLFVSMHISDNDYFGIGNRFLDGLGGDYLRRFEPIGARDESTLNMLKNKGIDAYLSGCMTLTLKLPETNKNDEVILVDVNKISAASLKNQFPNENWLEITHNINPLISQKMTLDERFDAVESLLIRYQKAKCVVTERLHCALPCLALGTPVLLLYKPEYLARMSTFLPLLHSMSIEEVTACSSQYNISSPPVNPSEYLRYRQELEQRCNEFVCKAEGKTFFNINYPLQDIFIWQKSLLNNSEITFSSKIEELQNWCAELERAKEWNVEQCISKDQRISQLESWTKELVRAKEWNVEQCTAKDYRIFQLECRITELVEKIDNLEMKNAELQKALMNEIEKPWYKKLIHSNES